MHFADLTKPLSLIAGGHVEDFCPSGGELSHPAGDLTVGRDFDHTD